MKEKKREGDGRGERGAQKVRGGQDENEKRVNKNPGHPLGMYPQVD